MIPITEDTKIYSITELTREIKILLETTLEVLWIEGEVSNFKRHTSGHMYFSLKDTGAQIPCVIWRNRAEQLTFAPQDGMKVHALGRVTLYEKRGAYQFEIMKLQPAGIGELQLALEQLKRKLMEEGLFDESHKQMLPRFPSSIGIITSPTGAAIRDLVTILNRRYPGVEIVLNSVNVQGVGAAEEIARAIDEFNEYGKVDVLIVGRGGGSLEDLWAFNEEIVARSIFRSKIPVISAVGHEIDFSISDFVADVRAPTPSAAAELVVPDSQELMEKVSFFIKKIYSSVDNTIQFGLERLNRLTKSYGFRRPLELIHQNEQRLDEMTKTFERIQLHRLEIMGERLASITQKLNMLTPDSILKRGYSICYRSADGEVVKRSDQLKQKDGIRVQFHIGNIRGTVDVVDE